MFSVNDNFLTKDVNLDADINYCIQVPEKVDSSLYEFYTLLVELDMPEEKIWNNIYHRTRDEINSFLSNQQFEYELIFDLSLKQFNEFVKLYDAFARLKGITKAERFRLKAYWENELFAVSYIKQGHEYLCINFYRVTKQRAANLYTFHLKQLHSGNLSSSHFGRAHRALHWLDIKSFKKMGVSNYDFCGWYNGTDNEQLLSINKFKEQFSSNPIKEYSGVVYKSKIVKWFKKQGSDKNQNTYNLNGVVKGYEKWDQLMECEISIFDRYKEKVGDANFLDIGIGGGRTTRNLISRCKKYTGIDYSINFVNSVKRHFPDEDIRLMDARNLSQFEENSFDFINFSFNGIDYVDLEGRTQVMKEVNRVLKPGGFFFFSTHNKCHPTFNKLPWLNKSNTMFTNIKTAIKLLPFMAKHYVKKMQEVICSDYAIINDSAHNYSLMTFYTTPDFLIKQLGNNGFSDVDLFLKSSMNSVDKKYDEWIFVICKKSVL